MCKNLFVIIGQRTGLGFERSGFQPCVDQHPEPLGSEVVRACLCFAVIRYVIVPENSKSIFSALLAVCWFLLRALIDSLGYFHCSVWLVCIIGFDFEVIQSNCALFN